MAPQLTPELAQRIINLLKPYMSDQERRAYIEPWCPRGSPLHGQIEWGGSDRVFTTHIVSLFQRYGIGESGETALQTLIKTVHEDMGVDDQNEAKAIWYELQRAATGRTRQEPSGSAPSKPSQPHRPQIWIYLSAIFIGGIIMAIAMMLPSAPSATLPPTATGTATATTTPYTLTPPVATHTPTARFFGTPVCTSIIGYENEEEEKIENDLRQKGGFNNTQDDLEFYNHPVNFAEVCVVQK